MLHQKEMPSAVWSPRRAFLVRCKKPATGILVSAVDGRFPIHGEVMPMTTYEKVALVLASLQLLAAILALFK